MIKLKENPRKESERRIVKTFTIRESSIKHLDKSLKDFGYKNGVSDINFSNLLSDLIDEYSDDLDKENKEDDFQD